MSGTTKWLSSAIGMFILFIFCLSSPLPASAAVPGIKLYDEGLGVTTWTSNASNPFTALEHWVLVVDHDATAIRSRSSLQPCRIKQKTYRILPAIRGRKRGYFKAVFALCTVFPGLSTNPTSS